MHIKVSGEGVLAEVRELSAKGSVFKRIARIEALGFVGELTLPDSLNESAKSLAGQMVSLEGQIVTGYQGRPEIKLTKISAASAAGRRAA